MHCSFFEIISEVHCNIYIYKIIYMFRAFYGLAQSIERATQSRNSYNARQSIESAGANSEEYGRAKRDVRCLYQSQIHGG